MQGCLLKASDAPGGGVPPPAPLGPRMRHRKSNGPWSYSSGRPGRVYSCYNQCLQTGLCPRLRDFPPAQTPLEAGHGARPWGGLPRLLRAAGHRGSPCLKKIGVSPSIVMADSTEITKEWFVCLFVYCGVFYMQEHKLDTRYLEGEPVGGRTLCCHSDPPSRTGSACRSA